MGIVAGLTPLVRLGARAQVFRAFGTRMKSTGSGAFFQDLPSSDESKPVQDQPTQYKTNKDLRSHPEISSKLNPVPQVGLDLLSPLKQALYRLNVETYGGSFRNNRPVKYQDKTYRLNLTREEQRALEPSVYIQSYRIKGSWKKTYLFLRLFRRMPLNDAISQCHFSARRMAREIGDMLERGKDDALKMGLVPEDLVIEQIWVGKDGGDEKRLQAKGRGRTGVITSPFVHVKAILKPKAVLAQKEQWIKERLDRKLWFPLQNRGIKDDFVQTANYKW